MVDSSTGFTNQVSSNGQKSLSYKPESLGYIFWLTLYYENGEPRRQQMDSVQNLYRQMEGQE